MARTVAGNEIILAMNRMIPPAISRNRMAWNGIRPLRHSRITPAFITSVTVDLHMPATVSYTHLTLPTILLV